MTAGMHVLKVFAGTNTNFFLKKIYLAVLGLSCGILGLISCCSKQELLFDAVLGLLIVGASLVVEHGL